VVDETGSGPSGVTMRLDGGRIESTTTARAGVYAFTRLAAGGDYTVTPSKAGYTFRAVDQFFKSLIGNETAANFRAASVEEIRRFIRCREDFVNRPRARGAVFAPPLATRLQAPKARRQLGRADDAAAHVDVRDVLGMWKCPDQARAFLEAEYRAVTNYVPQEYPGRITLFRARAGPTASPPAASTCGSCRGRTRPC